jgi:hypothetical protein
MSIVAFKKKSVINYGSKRSGKPPGGYWLPQGPFGHNSVPLEDGLNNYGPVGFSINGSHRSGFIGKTMKVSQQGTRFRGVYPIGYGGTCGQYYQAIPVMNAGEGIIDIKGNQWEFIKPSSLSTRGMLHKKYKWIYNGQYPNVWVQPNYGSSNLSDNTSQGLYIHTKTAANDCVVDVNNDTKYVGHTVKCGPNDCRTTSARGYKMTVQQSNAPYTKNIGKPQDSSQHTLRIQRQCADPRPEQKPFPYGVNGGACNSGPNFVVEPEWYRESISVN